MLSLRVMGAALIGAVALAAGAVSAQQSSSRAITVVSPFGSGTTNDLVARLVLDPVGRQIGQSFLLENRPGDDGTTGIMSVVKASPDGQTLLLSTSAMSTAVILHKSLPYDAVRDLTPVAMFGGEPSMLVGAPNKGYAKVADLVAAARAAPGTLKFASVRIGSASYIAAESFRVAAGIDVQHVAYPGPAQALADLTAGRVDFYFIPVIPALPLITEGRVTPLAVSTPHRLPSLSGLQTLAEAGYPMSPYLIWCGLSAPANTPHDIVDKLNAAVGQALALPAVRSQLLRTGYEPTPMSPGQYGKFFADEIAALTKLAKDAQIAPLR